MVYLCEHSERGALGLIINKPTDISLKGLFDKVDLSLGRDDLSDAPVFSEGRCRPSVVSCCMNRCMDRVTYPKSRPMLRPW